MPIYPYKYKYDGVEHEGNIECADKATAEKQILLDIKGSSDKEPKVKVEIGNALRKKAEDL